MITEDTAALIIGSDIHPVERVTEELGLEPTSSRRKGDQISRRNPSLLARDHRWIFNVNSGEVPASDQTGFGSVTLLVRRFLPLAEALASLRPDYWIRISWGGFSDSSQGGFVIPAELLRGLAVLNCDLHGTAYLDEPDTEAP